MKARLVQRQAIVVPGAGNALSARAIEDVGFEAVYVSGAGVTNMLLGLPDLGFIGLSDMALQVGFMREVVDLPLIVDADTGFGNAVNVQHTVRTLERAGANAIQIEDQVSPKRCGHFSGQEILPIEEAVGKVKAAVDARSAEDFLIIARTDARSAVGFAAAVNRACAYAEAGADITFVEAPQSMEEIAKLPQLIPVPQLINMVVGGKTPILEQRELAEMGFAMVLYANAALQGAIAGTKSALRHLATNGRIDERTGLIAEFGERQRLVRKSRFDELEARFSISTLK